MLDPNWLGNSVPAHNGRTVWGRAPSEARTGIGRNVRAMRRRDVVAAGLGLASGGGGGTMALLGYGALAQAQPAAGDPTTAWPTRPVTRVIPWVAGGSTDVSGRLPTARFAEAFRQPFVVLNRPGATGTIGRAEVVRARPDGLHRDGARAALSGEGQTTFAEFSVAIGRIRDRVIRPLAISRASRARQSPDVPTAAEASLADDEAVNRSPRR
ncbi:MAG: hypothetical protein IRZ13_11335 [Acetobacteraceae bacterium]|nr:hypothetical protein [Acetobacteraceae bacterium]